MPPGKRYDLNSISLKELLELDFPQEIAERLIKEREARKGFKSVKEATVILGIHPRDMQRFLDLFYVAPEPEQEDHNEEPVPGDSEEWKLLLTVRTDPPLSPESGEKIRLRLDYQATGEEGRVSELYQILLQEMYLLEVDPFPLVSELHATVENRQGQALLPQQLLTPEVVKEHSVLQADLQLSGEELDDALQTLRPETRESIKREGRFMVAGMPEASFEGFHLSVDLVDSQAKEDALGRIFPLKEEQAPSAVREIDLWNQDAVTAFSGFHLTAAEKLKYDGRFSFTRLLPEKKKDTVRGWVWFLNGPLIYAGYRREQEPHKPAKDLIILLPGSENAPGLMDPEISGCFEESGTPPLDVDEEHLLRDSQLFHDDPGPFCKPFSNPSRILGEKSFRTVLRVEQPEIAYTSPNRLDYTLLFPQQPMLEIHKKIQETQIQWQGKSSHLLRLLPDTPPGLSTLSLFPKKPQRPPRRRPISSRNPVDWDEDPTRHQALSLAGGHILEWRVQWRSNGYSLGDVKRTLTLAPRQTRRIVKVDWTRTEWARRDEAMVSADEFEEGAERAMDYNVAVSSNLQEWSKGGSRASTTGAAGGIGFAMGPVVVGGGAAHGRASSSSWQEGGRQVSASEQQRLREAIRQYGDSLRSLESTVVMEADQHEAAQGVSEIVRNPNYCHSLSVIYYEILRHLRVDTVLGGVRECVFVPFSITLFDLERVLQWKGPLQRYLRRKELRWALEHAEKVLAVKEAQGDSLATEEAWGDIPSGIRAEHSLRYLSGSLYIRLGIELPDIENLDEEGPEAETLEKLLENKEKMFKLAFHPYAFLLGRTVAETAWEMAKAKEARIQDYFSREVAPHMARNWVESLELSAGGSKLSGAVFSLASGYRHKGVHRVDFSVPLSTLEEEGVTRFMLKKVTVSAGADLPAGSVADCMQLRFVYETEQDKGRAASSWYTRRLVRSDSGTAGEEAELNLPLSSYEKQEPRKEILKAFDSILDHLNTNLHYYHKAIWWSMDRDELYTILDGYSVSGTDSRSIASVVEREPIAILGNSLVFPVAAGAFLGIDGHDSLQDLFNYYCQESQGSTPMRISLPTDGVYAQALKDQCHACEEHQGSTDWVLQDKDPELAELPPELLASRYQKPQDLQPSQFPEAIINNINLPQTPQAQGLEQAITAAGKKDAFRDMAGLEGTQKNAAAAMQKASDLAGRFGETAAAYNLARRSMDQDGLDRVMSSLEKWGERFDVPKEELGNIFTKFMENLSGESGKDVTEILEKLAQAIKSMSPGQTATITSLDGEKLFNIVLGQDSSGKEDDSQDEDQEDQEEEGEENNDKEDQEDGGENGEKEDAEEE